MIKQTIDEFCKDLVKEFEEKIDKLGAENVAAFIAEPILASGGCIVPPEGYFKKIYDICKKNEIIFIADEVVTGFGRLGHFFLQRRFLELCQILLLVLKELPQVIYLWEQLYFQIN